MLHVFDELCIDKVCPGEIRVVAYDSHGSPAMEKSVKTSGKARALVLTANGDPTCVLPFQEPRMKLFSEAATVIARASATPGTMKVRVSARGLRAAEIMVKVR